MEPIWKKAMSQPASKNTERRSARPPAAVELTRSGAVAVAGVPPSYSFIPLPAGALHPGVSQANLAAPDAVASAVREALDAVNPPKRAVTVVLPDAALRVFVLDFDQLPSKSTEALSILRFRLRKTVPFEVETASIGYQVLSNSKNECRVLVVVVPGTVLAEYEAAVRTAGYEPGAVLGSTLAALEAVETPQPSIVANLSAESLTTAIVTGNDLLLYRTAELPEEPEARIAEIQRGIAVTLAYFEDKTATPATRLLSTGLLPASEFAALLQMPELEVRELVEHPATGAATALGTTALAAATGALKGAGL